MRFIAQYFYPSAFHSPMSSTSNQTASDTATEDSIYNDELGELAVLETTGSQGGNQSPSPVGLPMPVLVPGTPDSDDERFIGSSCVLQKFCEAETQRQKVDRANAPNVRELGEFEEDRIDEYIDHLGERLENIEACINSYVGGGSAAVPPQILSQVQTAAVDTLREMGKDLKLGWRCQRCHFSGNFGLKCDCGGYVIEATEDGKAEKTVMWENEAIFSSSDDDDEDTDGDELAERERVERAQEVLAKRVVALGRSTSSYSSYSDELGSRQRASNLYSKTVSENVAAASIVADSEVSKRWGFDNTLVEEKREQDAKRKPTQKQQFATWKNRKFCSMCNIFMGCTKADAQRTGKHMCGKTTGGDFECATPNLWHTYRNVYTNNGPELTAIFENTDSQLNGDKWVKKM